MKRNSLLLLSLLMVATMLAGPVSKDEAMTKAQAFVNSKKKLQKSGPRRVKLAHAQAKMTQVPQDDALYYVFNVGERDGFVIVSGDDRTAAVLGYTDKGSFDTDNMPDNMRAWLQDYADQLAWLNEHPEATNEVPATEDAPAVAKAPTKNPIGPLMQSEWNQGEPYNNLCPTFPLTGKTSVTGCVATAMAQIMYFHRWPEKTNAAIPDYTASGEFNRQSYSYTVTGVPVNTEFKWDKMLPVYGDGIDVTTEQETAVATLMKACGASVQMNYTSSSSGANVYSSHLITYFNYSRSARDVSRNSYSLADWNNLIYAELAESRPVLYAGRSAGGGHQFVIDGYDGDELFHVNWGWGGNSDGYFLLSVLNPGSTAGIGASSTNDGYSFDQGAIIGIKPYDDEVADIDIKLSGNILSASNGEVKSEYRNQTGNTYSFDFGIGYVNDDGTIVSIKKTWTSDLPTGWGWNEYSFSIGSLPNGTYKIVPISREHNTSTWYSNVNVNSQFVEVVVSGGSIASMTLCPVLTVESFNYSGNKKANSEQPVDVTIKCTKGEFYGPLYLFASMTNEKGDEPQSTAGVTILKDKSSTLQFSFTPSEAGTYNIWICTDESGNNVVGTSSVEIEAGGVTTTDIDLTFIPVLSVLSADNNNILSPTLNVELTVNNPTENIYSPGKIKLIFREYGGGYIRTNSSWYEGVTIGSNGSKVFSFSRENLTKGYQYAIEVQYERNGGWVTYGTYQNKRYTAAEGVIIYNNNGKKSAVVAPGTYTIPTGTTAVDLRGNSTTTSVNWNGQENPNCLFILDAGATVPTGAGTNIVKGGNAENITLQDGYDFYSPVTFTADNITYTRTFDTGLTRNYENWTTIVLPFDVNKVTVDLTSAGHSQYAAYPIDWFHNPDETKKNFWVMEFGSEENGIVNFSHAAEIKAARPLLIAVPGAEWGSANDLTGLPITFHGQNVTVSGDFRAATSGDNYKMKGVVAQKALSNVYVLNDNGNAFTRQNSATVDAFRAYFEPTSTAATAPMLMMAFGDGNQGGTTALGSIFTDNRETNHANGWYMLDGRKLNGEPTQKGIYIYNGKKVKK